VALVISLGPKVRFWSSMFTNLPAMSFAALGFLILLAVTYVLTESTGIFLNRLANKEVARGVITFLFALTTVGVAVILALSTVLSAPSADDDKRFDRGKQVLSSLIGILGTIVGFYFGADTTQKSSLEITTSTLPHGDVNSAYSSTLQTTGGTSPMKWSATTLPAGLKLDPITGVISGKPTIPGLNSFTITVIDGSSTPILSHKNLSIEIKPAFEIATMTLPNGTVGTAYSAALEAKGGTQPLKWSAPSLPPGLSLDGITGMISGTPTAKTPPTAFTFTVIDSASPAASSQKQLTIAIE
jgi:hypothetical protein